MRISELLKWRVSFGLLLLALGSVCSTGTGASNLRASTILEPRNAWRGIVPLQSSANDVARLLGLEPERQPSTLGPVKVDGGQVTFHFLTPSLVRIYRAPRSWAGRVFSIYFEPEATLSKSELKLGSSFRRCVEDLSPSQYYLVSNVGVAYRFLRGSEQVDAVIYQPSRAAVRNLAVSTECVF